MLHFSFLILSIVGILNNNSFNFSFLNKVLEKLSLLKKYSFYSVLYIFYYFILELWNKIDAIKFLILFLVVESLDSCFLSLIFGLVALFLKIKDR